MWCILTFFLSCTPEEAPSFFDATDSIWTPTNGALRVSDYPLNEKRIQSILYLQEANSMTSIQLENTSLGVSEAVFLSQDHSTKKISYLSLKNNSIQNIGLQYIAQAPFIKSLIELNLDNTGISSKGLAYLLRNPDFGPKKLIISNNSFHSSVLNDLAKNTKIDTIDLSNCKLSQGGSSLIMAHSHARVLKLNQNDIGIPLKLSPFIEELHLYQTRLSDDQLTSLASIEAKGLKKLYLGRIFIDYNTLAHISHASWFPQLEVLSLNPRKQSTEQKEEFSKAFGTHRWLNLNDPPLEQEQEQQTMNTP